MIQHVSRARSSRSAGFTLVELLVVIVILGILSAVVVFAVRGSGDKGALAALDTDKRILQTAQESYCARFGKYGTERQLAGIDNAHDGKKHQFIAEESELNDIELTTGACGGTGYVIDPTDPGASVPPVLPNCTNFAVTTTTLVPAPLALEAAGVPLTPVSQALGTEAPRFEANRGQVDPEVRFLSRGPDYTLFLTPDEMVMSLPRRDPGAPPGTDAPTEADVVRMSLVGANTDPEVTGGDALESSSNYFSGDDPGAWRTDVPHYGRVEYASVYPGIDLIWHADTGQLEYDFVVAPGVDPGVIGIALSGAERLALDPEGRLVISTAAGDVVQGRPHLYQELDGARHEVPGDFVLDGDTVSFGIGAYDPDLPLVIDPVVIVYSTYLQALDGTDDVGFAVATDAAGSTYVTGWTDSNLFPTQNPVHSTTAGGESSIFVTKFTSQGQLDYSTYLSGEALLSTGPNAGHGISVDSSGNAYVAGVTSYPDYPIVPASTPSYHEGQPETPTAFLTKLNPAGNQILYSNRMGGTGNTVGTAVAVQGSAVYVTGDTEAADFFTKSDDMPQKGFGVKPDLFVMKFEGSALDLTYSRRLGGAAQDRANGIAADPSGNAYVTGRTGSEDFPGAAPALSGASDSFLLKLDAGGETATSRYLGGSGAENVGQRDLDVTAQGLSGIQKMPGGIARDGAGNIHVAGTTTSADFPGADPANSAIKGASDAFLATFDPEGTLVRSTYVGGSNDEEGAGVATDGSGNVYLTGRTTSSDLVPPSQVETVFQPARVGVDDAYVVKLGPDGALVWATYLGGNNEDKAYGVAAAADGSLHVTGLTYSTNFPTKNALQPTKTKSTGISAAFVSKLVTCQE